MTEDVDKSAQVREKTRTVTKTRTVKPLRSAESSRVREFAFFGKPLYRKREEKRGVVRITCFPFTYLFRKKDELANPRTSVGTKGLHGSCAVRGSRFLGNFETRPPFLRI